MREILFRGKCNEAGKYNGQWIEGFYGEDDGKPIIARSTDHGLIGYFCEPDSIGQYTGLTDKNGKKIFEGDILQGFWYCEGVRAKVVWIDDAATFGILYSFRKSGEETAWLNSSWYKFTSESPYFPEIIGNIYDNPELLGGESDG